MKVSSKSGPQADAASIRFGQRTPLEQPVLLSVDGRTLGSGVMRNASISGALVETTLELPLHTNLIITLATPGQDGAAAHVLYACVVRLDAVGLGVEWRDMASVDVMALLERPG